MGEQASVWGSKSLLIKSSVNCSCCVIFIFSNLVITKTPSTYIWTFRTGSRSIAASCWLITEIVLPSSFRYLKVWSTSPKGFDINSYLNVTFSNPRSVSKYWPSFALNPVLVWNFVAIPFSTVFKSKDSVYFSFNKGWIAATLAFTNAWSTLPSFVTSANL